MKTAAKDIVRLMALLESQSNATNSLRASHAICEGSFNSMKVDYPPLAGDQNVRDPFNTSSDLSKFGKQMVYNQSSNGGNKQLIEEDLAQQTLRNF